MDDTIDVLLGNVPRRAPQDIAGHRERVRTSVDRNPDFSGFADYELLEYLLFATIARKDTKAIAKELVRTFGSLSGVLHADFYELSRVDGVGEKTAHLLANVLPIVMRAEYSRYERRDVLGTAAAAARCLFARFLGQTKEQLLMASLNLNDELLQVDLIASGGIDSADVDVMRILRTADRNGAKKIILAHNHPGGTMSFSDADIEATARVVSCCMYTGFIFVDHLVFSGNAYLSMFGSNALSSVLEMCEKYCADVTVGLAKEKTKRAMLAKIREESGAENSNRYKLQVLDAYRRLFRLSAQERDELFAAMFTPVPVLESK